MEAYADTELNDSRPQLGSLSQPVPKSQGRGKFLTMDHRVTSAICIMHRQLAERVSMLGLSRSVNLCPSRLRQLFKEETGRSPMQYLKELRMQNAANILSSTFLSIKEIAFVSGMSDVSSFVREFKRRYGLTPSKFRGRSANY